MKNLIYSLTALLVFTTACQKQSVDSKSKVTPPLVNMSAAGSLTASPLICQIPSGGSLCSSTISWNTSGATDVKVMIEGMTFAAAISGSSVAPWISETPAKFELWADGVLLDTITVVGTKASLSAPSGKLTASSATCTINPGTGLCSITIGWTTNKVNNVKVMIEGMTFAAAISGSSVAPWISQNPAKFELWGDGILLDSITVVGVKPGSPPAIDPNHCKATDSTSLRTCYNGLLNRTYTGIAIMNDITCSGDHACAMTFTNFNGPVKIYGNSSSGKNVTLFHKDHFDYQIIAIFGSSQIEIRDIDFSEGELNKPAGLFKTPGYDRNLSCDVDQSKCTTPITVNFDSNNIVFNHISVLESKGQGIEVGNVNNITIQNSVIKHSWANGIWTTSGADPVPNAHVPNNILITNNSITDNRCSGIEMSAKGNSEVSRNYLSHNHMGSIYHVPGGQFAIEMNTTGLLIKDNEIANGKIDEDPVLASQGWMTIAMEFTDSHVHGVTVDHNNIHDNTGGGIIHDPSSGSRIDFGPVNATNNVFKNPASDFVNWDPGELIQSGNCSGTQCVYVP